MRVIKALKGDNSVSNNLVCIISSLYWISYCYLIDIYMNVWLHFSTPCMCASKCMIECLLEAMCVSALGILLSWEITFMFSFSMRFVACILSSLYWISYCYLIRYSCVL